MSMYKKFTKKTKIKRQGKYYNYVENKEDIIFIYQNPFGGEVDNMFSESKYSIIRAFLHSDGTVYAWDGDYLHEFIGKKISEIDSPVHLEIKDNNLIVYITSKISNSKELYSYLKNLNLGVFKLSNSSYMDIDWKYYGAYEDPIYLELANNMNSTIGDFFNMNENIEKASKKVKRLVKKAEKINLKDILDDESIEFYGLNTDYGNRSFAISYLDGQIYEGDVHKDIVEEFLNNNNMDADEYLNYSEGFVTNDEQDEIDIPMAFGSYIKGKDGKDYVAIYPGSLYYVGMNEIADIMRKKYPNAIICIDDNDRYMQEEGKEVYIEKI